MDRNGVIDKERRLKSKKLKANRGKTRVLCICTTLIKIDFYMNGQILHRLLLSLWRFCFHSEGNRTIIAHWDSIINPFKYVTHLSLWLIEEPLHTWDSRPPIPFCISFLNKKLFANFRHINTMSKICKTMCKTWEA